MRASKRQKTSQSTDDVEVEPLNTNGKAPEVKPGQGRLSWAITAGKLSNLKLLTLPHQELCENDVRVNIKAIGLNFADVFACLGLYSATPKGEFTPGLEFSGEVVEVYGKKASRTHNFKVGDKVMGLTRFGGYSSEIVVPSEYIQVCPEDWSFLEGASFLCQALTAWYGLVALGDVGKDTSQRKIVLIHSGAGGVGLCALQICKFLDAIPIVTVGNKDKQEFLKEQGLAEEQIIVRTQASEFEGQLKSALSQVKKKFKLEADTIDVALDSLCSDYFFPVYNCLSRGGRQVVFGAGDFMKCCSDGPNWLSLGWNYLKRPKLDPMQMISDNKSVMGFNLIWMWDKIEEMKKLLSEMMEHEWKPPHVGHVFEFHSALQALQFLQSGQNIGKVVLSTVELSSSHSSGQSN